MLSGYEGQTQGLEIEVCRCRHRHSSPERVLDWFVSPRLCGAARAR